MRDFDKLVTALRSIAVGEGIYGQQAHEYKQIARKALADVGINFEPPADVSAHASTALGPVNCSTRLRHQGLAYPRTCTRCGIGPCPFFSDDGASLLRAAQ